MLARNSSLLLVSCVPVIASCASSGGAHPDPVVPAEKPPMEAMLIPSGPPETRREDIVETLHGREVRDPYRWIEDGASPEV